MSRGTALKIFTLGIFLSLILVRFLRINADPPLSFPNGWRAYEPFTDESAKAYQARNFTLFGQWNLTPQDQYRFWKVLSPVWCYPLWGWFEIFKVSYASLRAFSWFWFCLGLLFIYFAGAGSSQKKSGLFAGLFYAFNFHLFIYSRLGLMETMLNSFLLLSFCLLVLSGKRKWLYPLSLLAFISAYFIKQNALLFAPVFLAGYFLTFGSPLKKKFWRSPANFISLAILAVFAGLLLYLWAQPLYRLYTVMNFRHGYGFPPDRSRRWLVIRPDFIRDSFSYHLSPLGWWQTFFAFDPMVGLLAVLEIILIIFLVVRRQKPENLEILAWVWLISIRVFLSVSSARVERFWMPQIPAMILLASAGFSRLENFLAKRIPRSGQIFFIALILAFSLGFNFCWWLKWFAHPRYEIIDQGKKLEQALGDQPAVVIGKWAGPLLLPGRRQYYYVKNIFNRSPEQLQSFGITHLLLGEVPQLVRDPSELENDPYLISYQSAFPGRFARKKLIASFKFYDGELLLYRLE